MTIDIVSHKDEIMAALPLAVNRGLEACGEQAIEHAQDNVSSYSWKAATGNLLNSFDKRVDGQTLTVGSGAKYAIYIEMGTGAANVAGGTSKSSWVYYDEYDGKFHRAFPRAPRPFLKPAMEDNIGEYMDTLKESLENAII